MKGLNYLFVFLCIAISVYSAYGFEVVNVNRGTVTKNLFDTYKNESSIGEGSSKTNDGSSGNDVKGSKIVFLLFLIAGFIFGVVFCFAGYRFFKFCIAVFGFFLGFFVALIFFEALIVGALGASGYFFYLNVVLGLLVGIVAGFLAFKFYLLSVFIVGGAFGAFGSFALAAVVGLFVNEDQEWIVDVVFFVSLVIFFLICGFIAIKIQKLMIIIGSSFIGSLQICALGNYGFNLFVDWDYFVIFALIGAVLLGCIGCYVQFKFTGKHHHHHHNHKEEYISEY
eukprot:TRINITY_DN664_c0_g1_i1.p1 TRINITY_DN664_c0_g1~~TRINITY_DN664_c0_g1_i1.p1  ORF type:complete len:282 (-),score=93.63 TRINITY_DN664_c0_g1_i1:1104-1949(-)